LVYRSLNSTPNSMDMLVDFMRGAGKNTMIMGDFKLPGIDCRAMTMVGGSDRQFLQACEEAELDGSWTPRPM
jgi:hypothetical protein